MKTKILVIIFENNIKLPYKWFCKIKFKGFVFWMLKLAVALIIQLNGNTIANLVDAINSGIISLNIILNNNKKFQYF